MRQFTLTIIVLCVFSLSSTAKAQLFLEEGKVVLAVEGGDHINKTIFISNTSAEDIRVKVYWEDFQYQPPYDGTKKFFPAGVGPISASRWVSYTPQEFTLPAYAKQKVDYSISVPKEMNRGYYGVLFFERSGQAVKDVSGLDIIVRVGCLFFFEPKNAERKASVNNVVIKDQHIVGDFVNTSAVTMLPRMVYYITDERGLVKDRGELKKIYVPAAATASWELPIPADLSPGRYSIVMNMDLSEENVLTKELSLIKEPSGQLNVEQTKD